MSRLEVCSFSLPLHGCAVLAAIDGFSSKPRAHQNHKMRPRRIRSEEEMARSTRPPQKSPGKKKRPRGVNL